MTDHLPAPGTERLLTSRFLLLLPRRRIASTRHLHSPGWGRCGRSAPVVQEVRSPQRPCCIALLGEFGHSLIRTDLLIGRAEGSDVVSRIEHIHRTAFVASFQALRSGQDRSTGSEGGISR